MPVLGRVGYLAAHPFYPQPGFEGSYVSFPVNAKSLIELLQRQRILAGPVTPLDYFRLLEADCEPLHDFGLFVNPYTAHQGDMSSPNGALSALARTPYVLFTRKPFDHYDSLRVGITSEVVAQAPEAIILAQALLTLYWEIPHTMHAGETALCDALLCHGGPSVRQFLREQNYFPYAYDLAWEWYCWKKTPYMFYRWVCHKGISDLEKRELSRALKRTIELNLRNLPAFAASLARTHGFEREDSLSFYQAFGYRFDLWSESAEAQLYGALSLLRESELAVVDLEEAS